MTTQRKLLLLIKNFGLFWVLDRAVEAQRAQASSRPTSLRNAIQTQLEPSLQCASW
jgi:hypothetical protein